jgi:hypothetical protein
VPYAIYIYVDVVRSGKFHGDLNGLPGIVIGTNE